MQCSILLIIQLIYCYITCTGYSSNFFTTKDGLYEPIKIEIPQSIWLKAFKPVPVFKSSVTIVVPVYVPNEDDELNTTEAVQVEETTIANEPITEQSVVANDTVIANDTLVEDEVITTTTQAPQQVTGELFRFPCACSNGECGCCSGAILQRFNMKACGNISFIPEDFVFDVKLSVNNNTVVRRRVSASDPPPVCFNPGRAPFIEVCAELSNIRIRNRNAYACLDIDANIGGFSVYTASFRCFGLGTKGIQTGLKPKPVKTPGPKPVSLFGGGGDSNKNGPASIASAVLGDGGGFFGGGDSDDDDGPLDVIGDAIGDLFDGRKIKDEA